MPTGSNTRCSVASNVIRLTLSPWFTREHDEVSAATGKLAAVKSASNCTACHTQADTGDYRERNIRIPR